MSQHTFTIQGVPISLDAGSDGIILYVGNGSSGLAGATVFLEVAPNGNVDMLIWDQQAEAASVDGNSVEPVRIRLSGGVVPLKAGTLSMQQPAHAG